MVLGFRFLGLRAEGVWFRVLGFWVLGFGVLGFGFRVCLGRLIKGLGDLGPYRIVLLYSSIYVHVGLPLKSEYSQGHTCLGGLL